MTIMLDILEYISEIWAGTYNGRSEQPQINTSVQLIADNLLATEAHPGIVELATDTETQTGTATDKVITPANLSARTATTTRKGVVELATDTEAKTGTDTTRAITPANLAAVLGATHGTHTVTAEEATANTVSITTGKSTATMFIVQVYRSNVMVMADAAVSLATGTLTVADGGATYSVTEGDVINWLVF